MRVPFVLQARETAFLKDSLGSTSARTKRSFRSRISFRLASRCIGLPTSSRADAAPFTHVSGWPAALLGQPPMCPVVKNSPHVRQSTLFASSYSTFRSPVPEPGQLRYQRPTTHDRRTLYRSLRLVRRLCNTPRSHPERALPLSPGMLREVGIYSLTLRR